MLDECWWSGPGFVFGFDFGSGSETETESVSESESESKLKLKLKFESLFELLAPQWLLPIAGVTVLVVATIVWPLN